MPPRGPFATFRRQVHVASDANPWDLPRQGPYGSLEEEDEGPEYDLEGNVVEELPEDPWGQQPRPLPE